MSSVEKDIELLRLQLDGYRKETEAVKLDLAAAKAQLAPVSDRSSSDRSTPADERDKESLAYADRDTKTLANALEVSMRSQIAMQAEIAQLKAMVAVYVSEKAEFESRVVDLSKHNSQYASHDSKKTQEIERQNLEIMVKDFYIKCLEGDVKTLRKVSDAELKSSWKVLKQGLAGIETVLNERKNSKQPVVAAEKEGLANNMSDRSEAERGAVEAEYSMVRGALRNRLVSLAMEKNNGGVSSLSMRTSPSGNDHASASPLKRSHSHQYTDFPVVVLPEPSPLKGFSSPKPIPVSAPEPSPPSKTFTAKTITVGMCHGCHERQKMVTLKPCNHVVPCGNCAYMLRLCPQCKNPICV